MCNCNKVNTCGEYIFSTCVKYEGELPETSKYFEDCEVSVHETIEELYTLIGTGSTSTGQYFAGEGLNLVNNVFSTKYGTVQGTSLEGSWRPTWDDVQNKPNISEPLNLVAGSNVTINGQYPNLTISAQGAGEENLIEKISLGSTQATVVDKVAFIPLATTVTPGLVKVGNGLTVQTDGTISATQSTYSAGAGLTLNGSTFSLPVTTQGTGTFVQSVTQGSSGLTVTLGTPSGATVPQGNIVELNTGTDTVSKSWSASILSQWLNSNKITLGVFGSSQLSSGAVILKPGNNIVIGQSGNEITINSTGSGGTTYTAGSGLTLTGTDFSLPISYTGTGNNVTNVTQNTNGITVELGTLPTYTAGNGLTLTGTNFSMPVTVNGTGTFVQSVAQNTNGLTVTMGTPSGSSYVAGSGLTLTGNSFSLPISTTGAGGYVTGVVQTANGLTVSYGTVPTTAQPTQTLKVNGQTTISLINTTHTYVSMDTTTSLCELTLPKGDFNGQMITILAYGPSDKILLGDLIEISEAAIGGASQIVGFHHAICFWDEEDYKWHVKVVS